VSTITPTLLNEFSIGPSHTLSLAESVNGTVSRGKNGLENLGLLFPLGPDESIPDLAFGTRQREFAGQLLWQLLKQANTTINVNDNVTWVLQTHAQRRNLLPAQPEGPAAWGNINGQFDFQTGPTAVEAARRRWNLHVGRSICQHFNRRVQWLQPIDCTAAGKIPV
jgi:hypothetical protein